MIWESTGTTKSEFVGSKEMSVNGQLTPSRLNPYVHGIQVGPQ